ncbi:KamA family radical SAM protein [Pelobacter sp. M08fum]|uniref:KamA family radical SAM protein n=1 Tax=Pelovirga terrestris TaxID=2771352 RepID=A0A8J6QS00_9BACT|nr:KamA family radical SAM protein [Pelovirga terrestris]
MELWQQRLKESVTTVEELAQRFGIDPEPLREVTARYPLKITPAYVDLIGEVGDPIWRQCVPDVLELEDGGYADPLAEAHYAPVPAIIHRYPDRVILLASNNCAGYCRFCTRKRKVGSSEHAVSFREQREGINYIAGDSRIRDVILSGGDPLILPDAVLEDLLARIHAIPHVEIIRIGSRVPVTLPERITPALCAMLKKYAPLYLNTHFNHPRELTPASAGACALLVDQGIVLGNQTVLLREVNDDVTTMTELLRGLLKIRVRPYYLHQMDLVQGTAHFRTPLQTGLDLIRSVRGPVSGLACPHFVVDLPGGKGKAPLLPDGLSYRDGKTLITTSDGEQVDYPDVLDTVSVANDPA